jgi:hypothetical protein
MSLVVKCNGCGKELSGSDHAISGDRMNGMGGGKMPSGRFDWCIGCAVIAFVAVEKGNES